MRIGELSDHEGIKRHYCQQKGSSSFKYNNIVVDNNITLQTIKEDLDMDL